MNKKEISQILAKKTNLKNFEAYYFIDLLVETFYEAIARGEKIMISNFGTFYIQNRAKKSVMDPNTREMLIIPKTKVLKFRPARNFKIS